MDLSLQILLKGVSTEDQKKKLASCSFGVKPYLRPSWIKKKKN
jgi:ribosomal protein L37E